MFLSSPSLQCACHPPHQLVRCAAPAVAHTLKVTRKRRQPKLITGKMHVPSESFGGKSPESKASKAMQNLFTFIAVKIVLAQLEGSGRGNLASYNAQGFTDLSSFMEENPLRDGDEWLGLLMKKNEMLGVRILEVRQAYATEDFEWDQLERLAKKEIGEANTVVMRKHANETFTRAMNAESAPERQLPGPTGDAP